MPELPGEALEVRLSADSGDYTTGIPVIRDALTGIWRPRGALTCLLVVIVAACARPPLVEQPVDRQS